MTGMVNEHRPGTNCVGHISDGFFVNITKRGMGTGGLRRCSHAQVDGEWGIGKRSSEGHRKYACGLV